MILNPDIEFIEKETINRLFSEANNHENIKIVGPKLLTGENKPQRWDHCESKGLLTKIALRSGNGHWKNLEKASEVAWVSGAFLMVEREIFSEINGFDENFFLYKEEEDLCLRIRNTGGKIWYFPGIKVKHIGSVVAKKTDHIEKSSKYFDEKHLRNRFGFLFFRTINKIHNKFYN